jgi:hypothetical protein
VEQEHPLFPKIERLREDLKKLTEEIGAPGEGKSKSYLHAASRS